MTETIIEWDTNLAFAKRLQLAVPDSAENKCPHSAKVRSANMPCHEFNRGYAVLLS